MLQVVISVLISLLFLAGSSQIAEPFLAALQFIAGVFFAAGAAAAGWQASRD